MNTTNYNCFFPYRLSVLSLKRCIRFLIRLELCVISIFLKLPVFCFHQQLLTFFLKAFLQPSFPCRFSCGCLWCFSSVIEQNTPSERMQHTPQQRMKRIRTSKFVICHSSNLDSHHIQKKKKKKHHRYEDQIQDIYQVFQDDAAGQLCSLEFLILSNRVSCRQTLPKSKLNMSKTKLLKV